MGRAFPGVNTIRKRLRDGTEVVYYYHRATGIRLQGKPGSAAFNNSLAAANAETGRRHTSNDMVGLIRGYTGSIEFRTQLATSTQAEYKRMLARAEQEFGDMPIALLDDKRTLQDFLEWRERVAETSGMREADNRLSALSAMVTWAKLRGLVETNHLRGFRRVYHANRAEIIWLKDHIEAFMRVAPTELQNALIIALHTGQRQADILRLTWDAYDGRFIRLRPSKGSRHGIAAPELTIPCSETLRRTLASIERTGPTILTTRTGRSFQKRWFAQQWAQATEAAKLDQARIPSLRTPVALHFHDLRGTTVTLLSEAGCTPQQVAAITGHALTTVYGILKRYLARTDGLAHEAIRNFENAPTSAFANQLQTRKPGGSSAEPNS